MYTGSSLHRRLLLFSAAPIKSFLRPYYPGTSRSISALYQPRPRAPLNRPYPPYPHQFPTTPFSLVQEPRKALSFWLITFTCLVLGSGVWIQDKYSNSGKDSSATSNFSDSVDPASTMTTTQVTPPGTVGNLTADQEAKLRELWVLTAKVCGIKEAQEHGEQQNNEPAPQSPPQEKKKTKRRYTWLGRAYDEEDTSSTTSTKEATNSLSSLTIADGDDKYGQSKEFQQALTDMTPEEIRTTLWNMVKHDNPDALLLRFLRARKWDVKKALVMLISTIRWRLLEVKVDDDIMKNGEALARQQAESSDPGQKKAGEEFLSQMRMGKSFLHGVDKDGRPICVVRVRLHRASDQSDKTLERFTVFTIESARLMLKPPVETAVSSAAHLTFRVKLTETDHHLRHDQLLPGQYGLHAGQIHDQVLRGQLPRVSRKRPHPQGSLDLFRFVPLSDRPRRLLIRVGIWNIIKGWLDPVVAAKIHFTKNLEDLQQFIHNDRIMKELEGGENWEYKYPEMKAGENKAMEDTAKRDELINERQELARGLEVATMEWITACNKDDKSAANAAQEKRSEVIEKLREQYWVLDPYVRARSLYDRNSVIQPGGKIDFYPVPSTQMNGSNGATNGSK